MNVNAVGRHVVEDSHVRSILMDAERQRLPDDGLATFGLRIINGD